MKIKNQKEIDEDAKSIFEKLKKNSLSSKTTSKKEFDLFSQSKFAKEIEYVKQLSKKTITDLAEYCDTWGESEATRCGLRNFLFML